MFALGSVVVELERHAVRKGERVHRLTPIEARLLGFLHERAGGIASRDELLREVWGYAPTVTSRAVDFTVMRLRRKIEVDAANPRHLLSIRGAGYRLEVGGEAVAPGGFVGRRAELDGLGALVAEHRLVTVVGTGGVGKTRLVDEWVATRDVEWPQRTLSLADARTTDDVARAVAAAFELAPGAREGLSEALDAAGATLVVLDNLEQVPGIGAVVARWLAAAPQLRVLATSRIALDAPGEAVFPLEPLPEDDAAALFVAQVGDARSVAADDPDVRRVVHALDGLPLAIEIAAARCALLTVGQLAKRLTPMLPVLVDPDREGRHSTVRKAIEWSWDLLEPAQREALARCSVFRGGFTLEAAEAVLGEGALDAIFALRKHSLVRAGPDPVRPGALRFSLLESVRELAASRLPVDDPAPARHAEHAVAHGEALARILVHERQDPDVYDALALEADNVLEVPRRFPGSDLAVRAALALHPLFEARGPADLHETLLDLAVRDASPALRPHALWARGRRRYVLGEAGVEADLDAALACGPDAALEGRIHASRGDYFQGVGRYPEALAAYDLALPLLREGGERTVEAHSVGGYGLALVEQGRAAEARDWMHRSLAMHRDVGNLRGEVVLLDHLGTAELQAGRAAEGRARFEESLSKAPRLRDRRLEANVRTHLGNACLRLGDPAAAVACWRAALEVHREVRNRRFEAVCLGNLGNVALAAGNLREARDAFEQARVVSARVGDLAIVASLTANLGQLLHEEGLLDEARAHLERALSEQEALGRARSATFTRLSLGALRLELGDLDGADAVLGAAVGAGDPRLRGLAIAWQGAVTARRGGNPEAAFAEASALLRGEDLALVEVLRGEERPGGGIDRRIARRVAAGT